MATIRIHDEANTTIENQEEVASFLDSQEVIYEQWDITCHFLLIFNRCICLIMNSNCSHFNSSFYLTS